MRVYIYRGGVRTLNGKAKEMNSVREGDVTGRRQRENGQGRM